MGQRAATIATVQARPRRAVERRFYIGMTVAMFVVVGIGFGPSIVNPATRIAPVTPLVAIHGAVYGAWLLVFLAQTTLVATRRVTAHRRLGTAAMLLVPIMVGLGYMTAIAMGRRGFELSGDIHVKGDP